MNHSRFLFGVLGVLAIVSGLPSAQAGVFGLPHFVTPGEFAIGFEPELTLSSEKSGLGANVKYTHGLSDLSNVTAILGTGADPKKFRLGTNLTFDFFPDLDKQPGVGIATQALYYRMSGVPSSVGRLELTAIPYVHKAFQSAGGEFEPFIALPFGFAFSEGQYHAISNITVGSLFKASEKFQYVMELGVAINNTDTYVSGGIIYFH